MTTRSLGPFRPVTDKSGKVKVVRKAARMAAGQRKNQAMKTAREEKAWRAKSKPKPLAIAWMKEDVTADEMIEFLSGAAKARGKG